MAGPLIAAIPPTAPGAASGALPASLPGTEAGGPSSADAFQRTLDAARVQAPGAVPSTEPGTVPGLPDFLRLPLDRGANLGQDVLNSLERFGRQVNRLERTSRFDPAGRSAGAGAPPALAPAPAGSAAPGVAGVGPAGPKPATDLEAIFRNSEAEQVKLFGLMIDVTMGHSASSSVNSTMKTLLTQSG